MTPDFNPTLNEAVARSLETERALLDQPTCYWTELAEICRLKRDQMIDCLLEVGMLPVRPEGGYFLFAGIRGMHGYLLEDIS
ncbi:unnamed protein product [Protopolystoma xenopodis]|uniref:Aminotransferase class I/classII domain-containing protein n=1 Tax=Protopolystoma xenopodis TaxID=117903 RepID=A0A448WKK1_9PLAT|nr:unnamed protein product [Protopolystoma xenopodis]